MRKRLEIARSNHKSISPQELKQLSDVVRLKVFETIKNAKSGHLGGCSSSTELMVTLYFGGYLRFNPQEPSHSERDRILIRGHEGPLRYVIFSLMGMIPEEELDTYRTYGTRLAGHEDMELMPGVDITPSGSLGMILSYGVGTAIHAQERKSDYRTIVFLGDGEEQEGNVSEAARHAASLGLSNLVCIIDSNGKQLSRPTREVDGGTNLAEVWSGYGWEVIEIADGHDISQIKEAYNQIPNATRPLLIIANTIKGKSIPGAEENFSGYHTISVCESVQLDTAIHDLETRITGTDTKKLIGRANDSISCPSRSSQNPNTTLTVNIEVNPNNNRSLDYSQAHYFARLSEALSTIDAPRLYVLTADFIRKDLVDMVQFPEFSRYIDAGIREQHTIAMAHGISVSDPNARIFVNYGDAFIYRASDQLNAATQGHSKMIIASEYSGLSQGQNGKTHQSSGQPGAMLDMPGVLFYEPGDVQDLFNVFNWAFSENPGVVYARLHRKEVSPLYRQDEDKGNFEHYITHDPGKPPQLVIVGSGFVIENCVKAAQKLELEYAIPTRVINLIHPQDLDDGFVSLLEDDVPVLTVYNGNPQIIQQAVSGAVMNSTLLRPSLVRGHGFQFGATGTFQQLERAYQMDEDGIIAVVQKQLSHHLR